MMMIAETKALSLLLSLRGTTLLELMLTLSIIGVLLLVAIPTGVEWRAKIRAEVTINQLFASIRYAQSEATRLGKRVILCPTTQGERCAVDWSTGYMIFVDQNGDRTVADSSQVLAVYRLQLAGDKLRWQGSRSQAYFEWMPSGLHRQQNGTFVYCSWRDNAYRQRRGLIVSKTGRVRFAPFEDGSLQFC